MEREIVEVLQEYYPVSFEEIEIGLSLNEKYHVRCKGGKEFFVRLQHNCHLISKQFEEDLQQTTFLIQNGIPTPRLLKCGLTSVGSGYWIFEWVHGENLVFKLSALPKEEQYNLGYRAGGILRSIHKLELDTLESGETATYVKNDILRCLGQYEQYKLTGAECYRGNIFEDYLTENNKMFQDEIPFTLLHGDFHAGNLIVDSDGNLHVIDWIYGKRGLAISDFVRIIVSASWSEDFAMGQIDGYFGKEITVGFWEYMKMYVAMHELDLLSLKFPDMPDGTAFALAQHNIAVKEYKNMKLLVPLFYKDR